MGLIRENKTFTSAATVMNLIRIRNVSIVFIGVLVGALLVTGEGEPLPVRVFVAALTAAIITGGGNALNDYFDLMIDKMNKPDRPIPSGRIQKSDALMLSVGLLLVGLGLSKTINEYCLVLAALNVVILVVYAAYSKKMLFIANLGVSYLVASVFIFGALATVDAGGRASFTQINIALILTACAFFMTLAREIIKDIEDIEGDQKMYSKTLPIVLGVRKAKIMAGIFAGLAIILSIIPLKAGYPNLNLRVYGTLITVSDLTFISALTMFASLAQRMMIIGMGLSLLGFLLGRILA